MAVCDAFWAGGLASPAVASRPSFDEYDEAIESLRRSGREVVPWIVAHLGHADADAREAAASVAEALLRRKRVPKREVQSVIEGLSSAATRAWSEDFGEKRANLAALLALGASRDRRGLPAIRHVLTSPSVADAELEQAAAEALAAAVGLSAGKGSDAVTAARRWLAEHANG